MGELPCSVATGRAPLPCTGKPWSGPGGQSLVRRWSSGSNTWPGRWLTRRNLVLLSIPCLLFAGLMLTNDLHHLMWVGFTYEGNVISQRGLANWIGVAYAFGGLGALNLIVFCWLFLRSPQHRWPVVIILSGQIVGRMVYTLDAARHRRV